METTTNPIWDSTWFITNILAMALANSRLVLKFCCPLESLFPEASMRNAKSTFSLQTPEPVNHRMKEISNLLV